MANNRVALDNARCNLIAKENEYYRAASEYLLLTEGINNPSEKEILKTKKYLSHIYFGLSLLLSTLFTERELDCIYEAACGEEIKGSAIALDRSVDVIKKKRMAVFQKLQAENVAHAVYRATRLGQLPRKDKPLFLKITETQEAENASA